MFETGNFNLIHVLTYVFLWTTLYFLLCLRDSKRSYEWHCRMVTVIHASIISALAFYGVFAIGPWPWTDAGGPNVPHQIRTITICLGYFLFDFGWCLYHRTEGPVMLTHHTLSIIGMTWCLMAGKYGTELVATIGGAEITNPLLQLRWFMKELGYYNTLWGDVIDWTFMLSFGFVRIYLGTILLYRYFQQPTDFLGRIGGTLIYSIGWIFFISILQYAIHKHKKRYQEKNIQQRQERTDASSLRSSLKKRSDENSSVCRNGSSGASRADDSSSNNHSATTPVKRVTFIGETDIPSQRELKHREGALAVNKNVVVKES